MIWVFDVMAIGFVDCGYLAFIVGFGGGGWWLGDALGGLWLVVY